MRSALRVKCARSQLSQESFGSATFNDAGALPTSFSLRVSAFKRFKCDGTEWGKAICYIRACSADQAKHDFSRDRLLSILWILRFLLSFIMVPWGMRLSIEQMDLKRMERSLYNRFASCPGSQSRLLFDEHAQHFLYH